MLIILQTWAQTGRAVAKLLSLPVTPEKEGAPSLSDYKNKFIFVSSFCLTQKEMFAEVLRVSGTKESDWTIKYESSAERFQEAGWCVLDLFDIMCGRGTGLLDERCTRAARLCLDIYVLILVGRVPRVRGRRGDMVFVRLFRNCRRRACARLGW